MIVELTELELAALTELVSRELGFLTPPGCVFIDEGKKRRALVLVYDRLVSAHNPRALHD